MYKIKSYIFKYYIIIAIVTLIIGVALYFAYPKVFAIGLSASEIQLGQKLLIITLANAAITLGTAAFPNIIIAYEKFAFQKGWAIFQIILKGSALTDSLTGT